MNPYISFKELQPKRVLRMRAAEIRKKKPYGESLKIVQEEKEGRYYEKVILETTIFRKEIFSLKEGKIILILEEESEELIGYEVENPQGQYTFYAISGKSITGLEYIKLQHGPVPDKFSFLIDFCYSENVIDYKVNLYKDREYNAITSKELKITKLSNEELEIINKVKKYFKNYTAEEIADYSHKEKAYINPKYKERISYDYAFDIDLK